MNAAARNHEPPNNPSGIMVRDVVIARAVHDLVPGQALDLGCGIGSQALMLARSGWRVTGVDISDHAIRIGNAAAQDQQLPARFITADTTSWEPDQLYDLVYSTYALPGGASSHQVIRTAIKALKPGGTLIVVEWDHSMAEPWGFGPDDLPSPSDLAAMVPGMEIQACESRDISKLLESDDTATIAYLHAHKPSTWVDPEVT